MKQVKKVINIILISVVAFGAVTLVVFLSSREGGGAELKGTYHSPTLFAMGTTLDITIQGRGGKRSKNDVNRAVALARRIENETSRFKPGSDVSRINTAAGVAPVEVGDATFNIIEKALEYGKMTGGAFDITVAPIVKLWGFYNQKYRVPTAKEIAAATALVDYRKVIIDARSKTVMLTDKGMKIDLGGIAKGYAVQAMCDLYKQMGVKHALINFGGAIGAVGNRADGKDWVIGIKDPRGEGGALVGELKVSNGFVSSSGDYERFFVKGSKRYFHIFDPSSGYNPKETMSATVVGPNSMDTDMLSTTLMVQGPRRGIELMKTRPGFEGLIVGNNGNIHFTPLMKSKYIIDLREKV